MDERESKNLDYWEGEFEVPFRDANADPQSFLLEMMLFDRHDFQGSISFPKNLGLRDHSQLIQMMGLLPAAERSTSILVSWHPTTTELPFTSPGVTPALPILRASIGTAPQMIFKPYVRGTDGVIRWGDRQIGTPDQIPDPLQRMLGVWNDRRGTVDPKKVLPGLAAEGFEVSLINIEPEPPKVLKVPTPANARWVVWINERGEGVAVPLVAVPALGVIGDFFKVVDEFLDARQERIAFIGELTTWLDDHGKSWQSIGSDLDAALGLLAGFVDSKSLSDWFTFMPSEWAKTLIAASVHGSLTMIAPNETRVLSRPEIERQLDRIRAQLETDIGSQ